MTIDQVLYEAKGRGRYQAQRDRRYAMGQTAHGTPRKQSYQFLKGMTREQINERQNAQQREWRSRATQKRHLAMGIRDMGAGI